MSGAVLPRKSESIRQATRDAGTVRREAGPAAIAMCGRASNRAIQSLVKTLPKQCTAYGSVLTP